MKSTVFVRPNLKMFLVGGVLLVAIQHLITNGQSQGEGLAKSMPVNAREMTESDLQELIQKATETPSVQIYMRISRCYEKRGEYRKALLFLRRAEKVGQSEEASD